ncbi:MAG: 4Fe-4S binding protein [Candidatus Schekmanbacteria bacterium]|nr:4Fe-4S binding protein [Candidatus Schekmanbacteria bacterium]
MTGMALLFAILLAIAYRFLRVEEDPRLEIVEGMLPGTNCGACGNPGCHAFAEALLRQTAAPGKCTVSSPTQVDAIARFLGVDAGVEEKRVARLHCGGGYGLALRQAEYQGYSSCRAAVLVSGGGGACGWGCLGLADCERACTFDAIKLNDRLLPVVDVDKCTACGDCVEVCPVDLFTIEPLSKRLIVQCNSPLKGEAARKVCSVACDACGRCAADAPDGAIEIVNGLPVVKVPSLTSERATFRCPTCAIQWVQGNQFADDTVAPLYEGGSIASAILSAHREDERASRG